MSVRERTCEDCDEPATRRTADGVWLCDADYELLCEQAEALPDIGSTPKAEGE